MNDFLVIEPTPELSSRFAVWCLGRDPRVQTVSAGGFLVPVDWYSDIPAELLSGAYVDGFALDRESPQPEAVGADLTASHHGNDVEVPEQRDEPSTPPPKVTVTTARKTTTPKRRSRARKVSEE